MPETAAEKNIAVLCNELAGAGRSVQLAATIDLLLTGKGIPHMQFTRNWPSDFSSFTDLFLVGGDGTLNYFINHYPGTRLPLVIFKGGTGNDFHWLLYGDITPESQLEKVLETAARPIDTGECNGRYFINGVGAGFEGEVAKALTARKKLPGNSSYLLTILQKIFSYRSQEYRIRSGNQVITGKKLLVDICNGRRAGGGFQVAPVARADDGCLDLVVAGALGSLKRLFYLPVIEKGKHLSLSFIQHYAVKTATIESDKRIQYHLDGEYGEADKLDIRVHKAALLFRY
ncbi:MAG: hypothetical protein HYZ15_11905 [Sphingobacteriales bacterium]|nr:hypothetical protein [Sphingobacteriales bacterium]